MISGKTTLNTITVSIQKPQNLTLLSGNVYSHIKSFGYKRFTGFVLSCFSTVLFKVNFYVLSGYLKVSRLMCLK